MRALSVRQPWAEMIASGIKTNEYRSRVTHYRGELLICVSLARNVAECVNADYDPNALARGVAVCIVRLVDCEERGPGDYAWVLREPRRVKPFAVKGMLNMFTVDDSLIKLVRS